MNRTSQNASRSLLHTQLRWFMRLRWTAAGVIITGGLANWAWLHWYERDAGILWVGAALAAFNAVIMTIDRRRSLFHERWAPLLALATVQLYFDLACLTTLVVWTGAAASPLLGFFVLHMVFASLLQPRVRAFVAAAVAVAAMCGALAISGHWPSARTEALTMIAWALLMLATVGLTDRVARGLYVREAVRERQNRRLRSMSARLVAHQQTMVQHEKLVAMGQLAAGIAHEITNPISNMDSVLQLMQRNPGTPRPEAINSMREQIQRVQHTVRQLTSFAHPGDGQLQMVPINDVVRKSLDMLGFDKRLRTVRLECSLSDDVGMARLNPHSMQQVLTNIVRNALDATEGLAAPRITIQTHRQGPNWAIEIADNGCGIPTENLNRVFEPFFTTKSVGKGTGLGLSISEKLVREQGGRLRVQSAPQQGAKFIIELPCVAASESPNIHRTATALV